MRRRRKNSKVSACYYSVSLRPRKSNRISFGKNKARKWPPWECGAGAFFSGGCRFSSRMSTCELCFRGFGGTRAFNVTTRVLRLLYYSWAETLTRDQWVPWLSFRVGFFPSRFRIILFSRERNFFLYPAKVWVESIKSLLWS